MGTEYPVGLFLSSGESTSDAVDGIRGGEGELVSGGGVVALVARWQVPVVEVVVQGDLAADAADEVGRVLGEAMGFRPRKLIVDLAGCRSIDARGVHVLVEARRRAVSVGVVLVVRPPEADAVRLLEHAAWQALIAPGGVSMPSGVEIGRALWTAEGPDGDVAASS